jgi:hypothetical protein
MEILAAIPEWFGSAVITALAGVGGFFGKEAWGALNRRRLRKGERLAALHDLRRLLEDSQSTFSSQNYLARRLMKRLPESHPNEVEAGLGFDETFYRLFENMDDEERELHALIRSTTLNSMWTLNKSLRDWAGTHSEFRSTKGGNPIHAEFAEDLRQLEHHLNQWFDKFDAFLPGDEKRSLVYLADEKAQGTGFPRRIERSVETLIAELSP